LQRDDAELDISDADLRKLSLAGGMMAQVARENPEITDNEFTAIVEALQQGWAISRAEATFVAEVAISDATTSFDRLRLSREFLKVCEPGEAREFLEVLFKVAAADGTVSDREAEHIRSIARELLLSNKEFAAARRRAVAATQS
jgi:tellurite resistance protein